MDPTGRRTVGDTVLGIVERGELGGVLSAVHRGGFGPVARVFDGARSPLAAQLERAHLPAPPETAAASSGGIVVVVVTAPGRAPLVAETLSRAGATQVYVTARSGVPASWESSGAATTDRSAEPI
ncbi:MAG: hypothetical protein IT337_08205 [Thermomicrobiales bacterium]|nr:hypothetical protein [Thermomicrobiales bacterium]